MCLCRWLDAPIPSFEELRSASTEDPDFPIVIFREQAGSQSLWVTRLTSHAKTQHRRLVFCSSRAKPECLGHEVIARILPAF
jgi:hypothetical protein